jgi:hypothetical protein
MVGLLNNTKFFFILLVVLSGCTTTVSEKESYVITDVWEEYPFNIHQEINPRYKALLNNGDTVPCSPHARIGDTIYYKYLKVK